MERDVLTYALLFDVYGDTLTEKQKLCCDLRYNQDLSLGEIGELEGISRQAVRDNLVRAEAQMQELEEKIGAIRRSLRISAGSCPISRDVITTFVPYAATPSQPSRHKYTNFIPILSTFLQNFPYLCPQIQFNTAL